MRERGESKQTVAEAGGSTALRIDLWAAVSVITSVNGALLCDVYVLLLRMCVVDVCTEVIFNSIINNHTKHKNKKSDFKKKKGELNIKTCCVTTKFHILQAL